MQDMLLFVSHPWYIHALKGPFSDKHHDIGSVALPFFSEIFFLKKKVEIFSKPFFLEAVLLEESNKKDQKEKY